MPLARFKKPKILYYTFKRLALRRQYKTAQEKKKKGNKMLVYVFFKTKTLILMLIMNLDICWSE